MTKNYLDAQRVQITRCFCCLFVFWWGREDKIKRKSTGVLFNPLFSFYLTFPCGLLFSKFNLYKNPLTRCIGMKLPHTNHKSNRLQALGKFSSCFIQDGNLQSLLVPWGDKRFYYLNIKYKTVNISLKITVLKSYFWTNPRVSMSVSTSLAFEKYCACHNI